MVVANYNSRLFPELTWKDLETVLQDQAASADQRAMVHYLIDGLRKQARYLTPIGLLREVAIITLAVTDKIGGEVHMSDSS